MIYCVEDDASIRELMIYTLKASGFEAQGFCDSAHFWKALKDNLPRLVILDIMLPDEDGISVLKKLRSAPYTAGIPVIMATAKGSEYDKICGLDLGADDYLVKPFGMMEMVSRIKAVLRRSSPPKSVEILRAGDIELYRNRHLVCICGSPVSLTLKEYELLQLFMENAGQAFSREQLLSLVWGSDFFGETRTVDVHIGTLRTKLGKSGSLIETVRGVGYRMEGEK